MTDAELARLIVDRALLEGDFVLRSGKRSTWYLDKYRFETDPELLRALGERIAAVAAEHEPDATRLAGPALGAVALAASAAMASGLPFMIVRGETKEYGTEKRIEGPFEAGELVCLVEDVVTSGGGSPRRCPRCERQASSSVRLSAWSIVRRADPTRSRASASACGRSFVPKSSWNCTKLPQIGAVEPNPKGC